MYWVQVGDDGPSARADHAMAYDMVRQCALLFGGTGAGGPCGDTWGSAGDGWTQLDDIGPSARELHAMAFDRTREMVVLWGGRDGAATALADTWGWDGRSWTQLSDLGPSGRWGHAMDFDASRDEVVLFGGRRDGEVLGDTWTWNGEAWRQVQDIGPEPRAEHQMVFDQASERVVLFGGDRGGQSDGTTWEWDGARWTQVADFGPSPRKHAVMIAGPRSSLLFGGEDGSPEGVRLGDTWEWADRRWTQRHDTGPAVRSGHAAVTDSERGSVVLFGGWIGAGPQPVPGSDTWELLLGAPADAGDGGFALFAEIANERFAQVLGKWTIELTVQLDTVSAVPIAGYFTVLNSSGAPIGSHSVMIPAQTQGAARSVDAAERPVKVRAQLWIDGQDREREVTV